jgi:serine phosphatase RsbU (regulator of sigma subunit)
VEVEDGASGDLVPQEPDPHATSGRGLLIIDAVADRWGVERVEDGKVVWFELDRPQAENTESAEHVESPEGGQEGSRTEVGSVPQPRLRSRLATGLSAVLGVAASLPAAAWTAEAAHPEPAWVSLGAGLVLISTLGGSFGAGVAVSLALGVGTIAFHAQDRLAGELSLPVLTLGVVSVGLLVTMFTWAGMELRARARTRAGLLDRLADLSAGLATVGSGQDAVHEVEQLAAAATEARSARALTMLPAVAEAAAGPGSVVLSLLGPTRLRSLELCAPRTPALPPAEVAAFRRAVAERCAQALERIELQQAERRARAEVELLADASRAISDSLSVERVIEALRGIVVPRLADRCAVVLDQPRRPGSAPEPGEQVAQDGTSSSVVVLELRSRGRRLGRFVASRDGADIDDEDRALLAELAARASVALDNARLYEEQAQATGVLEGSLLPYALLPVPRLDLGARYLAATRGHLAGGDFYDAVRTDDGVVLLVGDVQGKGVEAATLTAVARHTLRAAALAGEGPAGMLDRVNDALRYHQAERAVIDDDATVRFVTAAVACLVPADDGFRATVACGGHPHPVVVRAGGEVELVKASGPLLGVFDHVDCDEVELELGLADVMVLYTDGVTEHRSAEDLFDEMQLGRLLRNQLTITGAEDLAQVVLDTVVSISPTEHRDDIAVLVARVTRRSGPDQPLPTARLPGRFDPQGDGP